MDQYIFGYDEHRIQFLFNEKGINDGRELFLDSYVKQIYGELSPSYATETKGMYTGSLDVDNTGKIRFINDKNYINKMLNIFDGTTTQSLPVSPNPAF